jgi:hypothetical protein
MSAETNQIHQRIKERDARILSRVRNIQRRIYSDTDYLSTKTTAVPANPVPVPGTGR